MEEMVPVSQARSVGGWQRVGLPCLFLANAVLSLVGRWISSVRVAAVGKHGPRVADPFGQKKGGTVPSIFEEAAKPNHIRTAHDRNSGIWT